MKRYLQAAAAVCLGIFCSCSKIDLAGITDTVFVDIPMTYTGIEVESAIEVRLSEDCTAPQLEADVNLMPYIEIYEKDRTLRVKLSSGVRLTNSAWAAFKAVVTLPAKSDIGYVSLSGASSLISDIPFRSDVFSLTASGASLFTGAVSAEKLDIDLSGASLAEFGFLEGDRMKISASGASFLKFSGAVQSCNMVLGGASSVSGISDTWKYSLEIGRCTGSLSGASYAAFRSNGEISCTLSGGSCIYYYGDADISGSSSDGASSIVSDSQGQ